MMGVNEEISALVRLVYLGTEKDLSRIHIKRAHQLILRWKCAALYPPDLKGDAIPPPCPHLSFFTPDRLHEKIGMRLYSLAYRFREFFRINSFIQLIETGYIVDRGIRISLTLDVDAGLCHRKRIFIPELM